MKTRTSARRDFIRTLSTGGVSMSLLGLTQAKSEEAFLSGGNPATDYDLITENLLSKIINDAAIGKGVENCHPWSPTDNQLPICQILKEPDNTGFHIESNSNAGCHGGWEIIYRDIVPGKSYCFRAIARFVGIPHPVENISPEVYFFSGDNSRPSDWRFVEVSSQSNSEIVFDHSFLAPQEADRLVIRLILRWTAYGYVQFSGLSLTETVAASPSIVTIAVGSGWTPRNTVQENMNKCLDVIKKAARQGAEFILLPEVILTSGVGGSPDKLACPVPGKETDQIAECAQSNNIGVGFTIMEANGPLFHNTGLIFDNRGNIVSKYRKAHLSVGERWAGVTPGNELPVTNLLGEKVGMQICYDNVHPEGIRTLARKGAKIVFLPIMGDPRVDVVSSKNEKQKQWDLDLWNEIMSIRALDNHVWYVIARNKGLGSCIINPAGEIVAYKKTDEDILIAEVDTSFENNNSWIGSTHYNRYWRERRPSIYSALTNTNF